MTKDIPEGYAEIGSYRAIGHDGIMREIVFDPPVCAPMDEMFFGPDYVIVSGQKYDLTPIVGETGGS